MRKAIFSAFVVLLSSVGMLFGDEVLYLNIVSNAEASVIVCVPDAQVCGAVWQSSEALSPQASPEIPTVYASEFLPSPTITTGVPRDTNSICIGIPTVSNISAYNYSA